MVRKIYIRDHLKMLLSVWMLCLPPVCYVACPLPGLRVGEEVVWIRSYRFGQSLKLLNVLPDASSLLHFCSTIYISVIRLWFHCWFISVHLTSPAYLSVLGEGSLLSSSSWWFLPFSPLLKEFFGGVFPYQSWGSKDKWCCMLYRL